MRKFKRMKIISDLLAVAFKSPSARLELGLLFGVIINIVYIALNLFSAFVYMSVWSGAVAVYHTLFLSLRAYLISCREIYDDYSLPSEHSDKRPLRAGVILFISDLFASAMILYSILTERRVIYSGGVLFAFLGYAVYSFISSIIGMKKWSSDNKPLHFAARNMTFSVSLMSLFNLQYSLFSTLGIGSDAIRRINTASGALILGVIIFLPIKLILRTISAPGSSQKS